MWIVPKKEGPDRPLVQLNTSIRTGVVLLLGLEYQRLRVKEILHTRIYLSVVPPQGLRTTGDSSPDFRLYVPHPGTSLSVRAWGQRLSDIDQAILFASAPRRRARKAHSILGLKFVTVERTV